MAKAGLKGFVPILLCSKVACGVRDLESRLITTLYCQKKTILTVDGYKKFGYFNCNSQLQPICKPECYQQSKKSKTRRSAPS